MLEKTSFPNFAKANLKTALLLLAGLLLSVACAVEEGPSNDDVTTPNEAKTRIQTDQGITPDSLSGDTPGPSPTPDEIPGVTPDPVTETPEASTGLRSIPTAGTAPSAAYLIRRRLRPNCCPITPWP